MTRSGGQKGKQYGVITVALEETVQAKDFTYNGGIVHESKLSEAYS